LKTTTRVDRGQRRPRCDGRRATDDDVALAAAIAAGDIGNGDRAEAPLPSTASRRSRI
jgi:hypothetical protein